MMPDLPNLDLPIPNILGRRFKLTSADMEVEIAGLIGRNAFGIPVYYVVGRGSFFQLAANFLDWEFGEAYQEQFERMMKQIREMKSKGI